MPPPTIRIRKAAGIWVSARYFFRGSFALDSRVETMWATMCSASRPDTSHQRRAQRVEEEKPDEVETGTGLDDAPIMNGETVAGRQREIDPVEIRSESRAPNDVRHLEDRSILEERISVLHACHSRHSLDAGGGEVLSSHTP